MAAAVGGGSGEGGAGLGGAAGPGSVLGPRGPDPSAGASEDPARGPTPSALHPEEVAARLQRMRRELSNRRKILVKNLPQDSNCQVLGDIWAGLPREAARRRPSWCPAPWNGRGEGGRRCRVRTVRGFCTAAPHPSLLSLRPPSRVAD